VRIERGLGEIVEFDGCGEGYMRIISPQLGGFEYARWKIVIHVLRISSEHDLSMAGSRSLTSPKHH
jgi:hypothetical protein